MGQPQNNQGKQSQQNQQQSSQPRDTRKELGQQNQQKKQQGEPQNGEKSPQDPANQLTRGGKKDDPNAKSPQRDDDTPPWFAALPPEIRDAIDAGRGEEIPAKYQELVRRYNLWLQKQRRTGR